MIDITQEQIMERRGIDNSDAPLVSIRCITYNHEPYIDQALDGFLMQKTTFPFEIIIHDDASTDKTADVIREYEIKFPKIIKPIYETANQYSKHDGSLARIVDSVLKGKYVAFCEGDDYWINENKLQMQIDYLENNSDVGLVYTYSKVFYQEENRIAKNKIGNPFISYEDVFINGNCVPTLTLCMRTELYKEYLQDIPFEDKKNWKMGDLPLCLWFIKNSKIHLIPKVTAMYRVLTESASHSADNDKMVAFNQSIYDIRAYFAKKYGDMELIEQFALSKKIDSAWQERKREEFVSFYKDFHYPTKILKIKNLIYTNNFLYKLFCLLKKNKSNKNI